MNDRTKEMLASLEDGISKLADSGEWQRYLATMAKFHRYSFGNVMLILFQNPDATQVMGFGNKAGTSGWKSLGRSVKKGEHAIWILAPMTRSETDEDTGAKSQVVFGWKTVPVFDVSQTEGAPLPEVTRCLDGQDPDGLFGQLADAALALGVASVADADLGQANGVTHKDGRIEIHPDRSPLHRAKTLAHEIAHWQLGHLADGNKSGRGLCELEAESVAYAVMGSLGFDSGDYSFGYVAGWAEDAEKAKDGIRASAGRIQKAVTAILGELGKAAAADGSERELAAVAA
jgi:antirestriction protein ArdC